MAILQCKNGRNRNKIMPTFHINFLLPSIPLILQYTNYTPMELLKGNFI